MSDSPLDSKDPRGELDEAAPDERLGKLRKLIVAPTDDRIDRLEQQLDDPDQRAREISRVLPQAVVLGAAKDDELASALAPITESAIRASIQRDRRILVDALFPVMGPAIRKAIASTVQGLIQNFNLLLEHSVSIKGLRWRLEALRTGRSYAEVVLLNTLVYQVEQVFLIHRSSGLMVQHVVAKTAVAQNPDMVSGMLTAIKDFVQDSFGANQDDTLDTFQVGERKVWVEHGTHAMLAVVIRGNPPVELREMMRDSLDDVHFNKSQLLADFDGDAAPFDTIRPTLTGLLQIQFKKPQNKISYKLIVLGVVSAVLLIWGLFHWSSTLRRWAYFHEQLRNQPGIVVTDINKKDGRRHVYGMKDPYALEPAALLKTAGIAPGKVAFHWEPYQSAHPEFVLRRVSALFKPPASIELTIDQGVLQAVGSARGLWIEDARRLARMVPWIDQYIDRLVVDIGHHLQQPETISLTLDGKILRASGSAPQAWILAARTDAALLPGIETYDDADVVDADEQAWIENTRAINDAAFYFDTGGNKLAKGQNKQFRSFIGAVKGLIALSELLDRRLRIDVIGHADQTGDAGRNKALSRKRASTFADLLIGAGINKRFIVIRAAGSDDPIQPEINATNRLFNRRVVFKVHRTDT